MEVNDGDKDAYPEESRSRVWSAVRRTVVLDYSDDESEIGLASIGQMVVTVRACAKEIREICSNTDKKKTRRSSRSSKRNENGKKKTDRTNCDTDGNESGKGHISGPLLERTEASDVSEEFDQKTSPRHGVWTSKTNADASSAASRRRDTTIVQEKHILDKVFDRLNGSSTAWRRKATAAPGDTSCEHTTASKPAIEIRDQFSSYGAPLPGIASAGADQLPGRNT